MRAGFGISVLLLLALSAPLAAEAPGTILVLQVSGRETPGRVPAAMPDRFTLLEDGNVYVGGTSAAATAHLEKTEIREIEKSLDRVRKIAGLGSQVTFGPGESKQRLLVRKGRVLDITATGAPLRRPRLSVL